MALPGMEGPARERPAPEWPGAASSKFADAFTGKAASKRIVETGCREGAPHGIAQQGLGAYFADTAGLAANEGKRLFAERAGHEIDWRPSRRCLSEPGSQHVEKNEGRHMPEPPPRRVCSIRERRHLRQVSSKEEYHDRRAGTHTVYRENGLRAYDQPAREVDLSSEMQRKHRPLDLGSQRNQLGCRAMGDKAYRHPHYDNGFYKVGGLIVGSSFHRGNLPKTEPRNNTNIQIVLENRPPLISYKEKQQTLLEEEVINEVRALTRSWEASTLKECDDKYVDPESDEEELEVK